MHAESVATYHGLDQQCRSRCRMDMVRCPRCAKQIPSFSRFCGRCGCAVSRTAGFGMQVPPPVPTQTTGERQQPASSTRNRPLPPRPPAKQGSGIGFFILIAIVTALIAMSSRRAARPRSAPPPPPVRFYQPAPRERLNAVPWHFQFDQGGSARVAASVDVYPRSSRQAEIKKRRVTVSTDEVIDRIIRKASQYLERIEADRGAIHKSVAANDRGMQP